MTNLKCDMESSVPDWVIEYPQALAVFQKLGIDFSCGGKSLEFACRQQGLDTEFVMAKLHKSIEADHNTASKPPARQTKRQLKLEERLMAIMHAKPGEIVDVRLLGLALTDAITTTLVKTGALEVVRMVMKAGKTISDHKAPGEIIVQCLEGQIAFTALDKT